MDTKLISAFPATGKTLYFQNNKNVLDSDSSKFDKALFPENYINHIKENIGHVKIILISSHDIVREALTREGLEYTLVFPDKSLKQEYVKRFKARGNNNSFIELLNNNWDEWINQLQNQKGCKKIVLNKGEYLSNVL